MRPSEEAKKYIGQREISGNHGFLDPKFQAEMVEDGWRDGYAWCSVFCKVVFMNCYPEKAAELKRVFTPGVLKTFANMRDEAYLIGNLPQIDSLVCWAQVKSGKRTGNGHAGIVTEVLPNYSFKSVEGNTATGKPGEREGVIVAENKHKLNLNVTNGLEIMGFVQIPKPITLNLNV